MVRRTRPIESTLLPKVQDWYVLLLYLQISPNFSAVLRHIGNTHAADSHLSIICPIPGCAREDPYTKYESFQSHVYQKHRDILDRGLPRSTVGGAGNNDPEDYPEFENEC